MTQGKLAITTGWFAAALLAAHVTWAAADPAPAAATPMQVTGKIHAIDTVNQVIKMEGGDFYVVPASIKLADLKEGDQVILAGEKGPFGRLQVKSVTKK